MTTTNSTRPRLVLGCMTGTSLDALDVAAILVHGHGLAMRAQVVGSLTRELASLAPRLRALAESQPFTAREIARLALDFGELHASACAALAEDLAERHGRPALVAVHGQTVFHAPPLSWQMVNPWPIRRALACPVVSDLRGADLAQGGQGAPITPIADWVLFRSEHEDRVVMNLGGYCNITHVPIAPTACMPLKTASSPTSVQPVPPTRESTEFLSAGLPWHEQVSGRDVCACNHLLDAAARAALGLDFDPSGENALKGMTDATAHEELARALRRQSELGRSLGSGDEATAWVARWQERLSGPDLLASCAAALGEVIAEAVTSPQQRAPSVSDRSVDQQRAPIASDPLAHARGSFSTRSSRPHLRVILAGGGAYNAALVRELSRRVGDRGVVERSDHLGVPISVREAAEMAVLGALSMDGVPITLPGVTRVQGRPPVAGAWYGRATEVPSSGLQCSGSSNIKSTEVGKDTDFSGTAPLPPPPPDRSHILTEQRNPRTENLDERTTLELVRTLNDEDATVAAAVRAAEREIAAFIEALEQRMRAGLPDGAPFDWYAAGRPRLVSIGAGTSGRLAVLDASECPPTFQIDPEMIHGIIAGGDASLRRSSESREDEPDGADDELERLGIGPRDTLLGIAAGGTTPYVLGAIAIARRRGALTGLLSCAPLKQPSEAHHHIIVATGPEAITGSTRLKAGTATKLVLNTISTALMVRLGKVHGNLMVDLRASNAKLRDRAARIVDALTGLDRDDSLRALADAGGNPKVAAVMCLRGLPRDHAEELLRHHGGRLRAALAGS
ncbi:MAG: N-acetylmuramic acid 6-phosphate etherase [Phycisphaerales bacterium]